MSEPRPKQGAVVGVKSDLLPDGPFKSIFVYEPYTRLDMATDRITLLKDFARVMYLLSQGDIHNFPKYKSPPETPSDIIEGIQYYGRDMHEEQTEACFFNSMQSLLRYCNLACAYSAFLFIEGKGWFYTDTTISGGDLIDRWFPISVTASTASKKGNN